MFMDLDGTMLSLPDDHISPRVLGAIRQLRENGHMALACTGRPLHMVPQTLWDAGISGVITVSGSYVQLEDTLLYEVFYPQPLARRLLGLLERGGIPSVLEGNRESIVFSPGADKMYAGDGARSVSSLEELETRLPDYRFNKWVIRLQDRPLLGDALPELEEQMYFCDTNTGYYEVSMRGVSKDKGIRAVLEHLGRDTRNTYGIGDSDNDLGMLEFVETAIAMGNAQEHIKAAADYITKPLEEDGVYWALRHFGLI